MVGQMASLGTPMLVLTSTQLVFVHYLRKIDIDLYVLIVYEVVLFASLLLLFNNTFI